MNKKIGTWLVGISLLFFVGARIQTPAAEIEYVGAETCLECHDNLHKKVLFTPHLDQTLIKGETTVEYCEACHGPGGIHIEDPGAKGSIRNFKDTQSQEITETCLECHKKNHNLKNFTSEKHYLTDDSCLSCHSAHPDQPRPMLLAQRNEELCFSCHQEQKAEFNLPYHHKVAENRMQCWSCHDPHETRTSPQSIGFKQINKSCFKCHPSQRGPFMYEHLASNVGTCQACHVAHGSENARLLRRPNQHLLCLECHSGPSQPDGLLGPKTPSFHITTKATYQNCTVCHVKIHGSFLDHYFLR